MFARHPEAAGVERAIYDRSARAVRADTVEVWTGVFVCANRFLELNTSIALDIFTCNYQKVKGAEQQPLITTSANSRSKRAVSIEIAEQESDRKFFRNRRPCEMIGLS